MTTLVLTALGDDQAGLVNALADVIAGNGGSWSESHMAQLAGKFAGIVVATVPDAKANDLVAALKPLEAQGLLDISVEVADDARPIATPTLAVELLGQDRTGIISDLSGALAAIGVSIQELTTEVRSAPMAGGELFEAHATLATPPEVDQTQVEDALADLRSEFVVELQPITT